MHISFLKQDEKKWRFWYLKEIIADLHYTLRWPAIDHNRFPIWVSLLQRDAKLFIFFTNRYGIEITKNSKHWNYSTFKWNPSASSAVAKFVGFFRWITLLVHWSYPWDSVTDLKDLKSLSSVKIWAHYSSNRNLPVQSLSRMPTTST